MVFKNSLVLLLIPVVLAVMAFFALKQKKPALQFSSSLLLNGLPVSWKVKARKILPILKVISVLLFIIALAGPRDVSEETLTHSEGIDIVLAVDASGSMLAEDFEIGGKRMNRLEAVKRVVKEFIEERGNDRIGLVAFAGLAYTVCPLTTDYSWLDENLQRVEIGLIKDGTAVGSAIASSLSRIKNSEAKSKIIILLTDGVNNSGKMDPVAAAHTAEAFGVKIYTIGAGSKGYAPFPVRDFFGRTVYQRVNIDIDEETLKEIASVTGAKYFRATDTDSLRRIYEEIDKLETSEIEQIGYFQITELFDRVLLGALAALLLFLVLDRTVLLKLP